LGLVALISLLMQIQSGDINPLALFAKKAPAAGAKAGTKAGAKGKKGKAPPMLPPTVRPLRGAADLYVKARDREVLRGEIQQRETWQAFARMDEAAAAVILTALEDKDAVAILSHLQEHELARILEVTPRDKAAAWVKALYNLQPLDPVPVPFRDRAKRAGLYDDTQDLLQQWESQQAAQDVASTPGTGTVLGTAPSASPGTAAPAQPGTSSPAQPGTATPAQPGTASPAQPGTPAPAAPGVSPAQPGGATTAAPATAVPTSPASLSGAQTKSGSKKPRSGSRPGKVPRRQRDKRGPVPPGLTIA
jgi:hypothetical protein